MDKRILCIVLSALMMLALTGCAHAGTAAYSDCAPDT